MTFDLKLISHFFKKYIQYQYVFFICSLFPLSLRERIKIGLINYEKNSYHMRRKRSIESPGCDAAIFPKKEISYLKYCLDVGRWPHYRRTDAKISGRTRTPSSTSRRPQKMSFYDVQLFSKRWVSTISWNYYWARYPDFRAHCLGLF